MAISYVVPKAVINRRHLNKKSKIGKTTASFSIKIQGLSQIQNPKMVIYVLYKCLRKMEKVSRAQVLWLELFGKRKDNPVGIYLLKVNNRNTRTRCEICSKLTIKTPERRY